MRTMNRFDAIALACVLLGCEARATRAEPPGRDRPSSPAAAPAEPLDYVERCVASTCDASLPTLVVIHGLGDRPEAFVELFTTLPTPARVIALRAPLVWGDGFAWFPYRSRTTSPETIAAALRSVVPRVLATIDRVCRVRSCQGDPVVAGFSQGGMASYALAALAPERFGAAFPVAGFLAAGLDPIPADHRPTIRAFHGGSDDIVSVDRDREGVDRLRAAGFDVDLRVEPDVRHTIPPVTREALLSAIAAALSR